MLLHESDPAAPWMQQDPHCAKQGETTETCRPSLRIRFPCDTQQATAEVSKVHRDKQCLGSPGLVAVVPSPAPALPGPPLSPGLPPAPHPACGSDCPTRVEAIAGQVPAAFRATRGLHGLHAEATRMLPSGQQLCEM